MSGTDTIHPPLPAPDPAAANRRLMWWIAVVPMAMLLIGLFAMKPLFTLWCQREGGAVNPNNATAAAAAPVATGRFITVYWRSEIFDRMPVTFRVEKDREQVEVGRESRNQYVVKNLSDRPIRLRPIHQVSPLQATTAFGMRICFCFQEQDLAPREEKVFPIAYTFDPALDERVDAVTLKYSLFEVRPEGVSAEQLAIERQIKAAVLAEAGEPAAAGTATPTSLTRAAP